MGVTIHYSGKLNKATELQLMIEEVQDIAVIKGWKYYDFANQFANHTFSEEPDLDHFLGIVIVPEDCDPICLTFLSNGKLCGLLNFRIIQEDRIVQEDLAYGLFIKTQKAGVETHKDIILLLDYISDRYLNDFKCYDEGEYWETRDENILKDTFNRYDTFIEGFASSLEMIPPNDGENLEDHLLRLANISNDKIPNLATELPNLSVEEENQFKRMTINQENGSFLKKEDAMIPPEIEGQFLDYVMEFEKQFKKNRQITVYEKIGKPNYSKSIDLSAEKLKEELERIYKLLEENNLFLELLYDYDNETLLIYDFITTELFNVEINDIAISGMHTNFIYEEFHPNHEEDLRKDSYNFWNSYFKNDSEHFDEFTLGHLFNSDEMSDFRYSFKSFKKIKITVLEASFDIEEKKATTQVHLEFNAQIDAQNQIHFDSESIMEFKYQHEYWHLTEVTLPAEK